MVLQNTGPALPPELMLTHLSEADDDFYVTRLPYIVPEGNVTHIQNNLIHITKTQSFLNLLKRETNIVSLFKECRLLLCYTGVNV